MGGWTQIAQSRTPGDSRQKTEERREETRTTASSSQSEPSGPSTASRTPSSSMSASTLIARALQNLIHCRPGARPELRRRVLHLGPAIVYKSLKVSEVSWNMANNVSRRTFVTMSADLASMSRSRFKVFESSWNIANNEVWCKFLNYLGGSYIYVRRHLQAVSRSLSPVGTLTAMRVGARS